MALTPRPIPSMPPDQHTGHNRYPRRVPAISVLAFVPAVTPVSPPTGASAQITPQTQCSNMASADMPTRQTCHNAEKSNGYNSKDDGNPEGASRGLCLAPPTPVEPNGRTLLLGTDRKRPAAPPTPTSTVFAALEGGAGFNKRQKHSTITWDLPHDAPPPTLPQHLWTKVFAMMHPADLGRLRQTCTLFKQCLHEEVVWSRSRRLHFPDHPGPVFGLTEWDMFGLRWGKGCMLCSKGRRPKVNTNGKSFHGKPRVHVYWPFRTRCCRECFNENNTKEFTLLSPPISFPPTLLPGLPFGVVDLRNHWISNPGHFQPNIGLTKVYWNPDTKDILARYEDAKESGTEEEWLRVLAKEGLSHKLDMIKIERFKEIETPENSSGEEEISRRPTRAATGNHCSRNSGVLNSPTQSSPLTEQARLPLQIPGQQVGRQKYISNRTCPPSSGAVMMSEESVENHQFDLAEMTTSRFENGSVRRIHSLSCRPARIPQAVVEMMAQRKADIEARCLQIVPPLSRGTLILMPAFQAAIKIATPLNEAAWDSLRERLVEQRLAAEEKQGLGENQHEEQLAQDRTRGKEKSGHMELSSKEKILVRENLAIYAAEIVQAWNVQFKNGKLLEASAPTFAIDLLTHCRHRFYSDFPYSVEDPCSRELLDTSNLEGQARLETPTTWRLTLSDMMWTYNSEIKPLVDTHGKELFICKGKGCDKVAKYYALDGLIQHYAAKHTRVFSDHGKWKADWPAHPPFRPKLEILETTRLETEEPVIPDSMQQIWQVNPSSHLPIPPKTPQLEHYAIYPYPPHGKPLLPLHQSHSEETSDLEINKLHSLRHDVVARYARRAWAKTSGVKGLPPSVRIHVVISKTISKLETIFFHPPPFQMFMRALAEHNLMMPMRVVSGLTCLACYASPPLGGICQEATLFTLDALFKHFQQIHLDNQAAAKIDWTTDMVKLPDAETIGDFRQAKGMTKEKYLFLKEVLPLTFPLPWLLQSEQARDFRPPAVTRGSSNALPPPKVSVNSDEPASPGHLRDQYRLAEKEKLSSPSCLENRVPSLPGSIVPSPGTLLTPGVPSPGAPPRSELQTGPPGMTTQVPEKTLDATPLTGVELFFEKFMQNAPAQDEHSVGIKIEEPKIEPSCIKYYNAESPPCAHQSKESSLAPPDEQRLANDCRGLNDNNTSPRSARYNTTNANSSHLCQAEDYDRPGQYGAQAQSFPLGNSTRDHPQGDITSSISQNRTLREPYNPQDHYRSRPPIGNYYQGRHSQASNGYKKPNTRYLGSYSHYGNHNRQLSRPRDRATEISEIQPYNYTAARGSVGSTYQYRARSRSPSSRSHDFRAPPQSPYSFDNRARSDSGRDREYSNRDRLYDRLRVGNERKRDREERDWRRQ